MRAKWNSIIIKLIIAFIVVILPLYVLSVILTSNSSGQMREEIENSNESVLLFHYSNLQFELNRMLTLIAEYSVDREIADFRTLIPVMSSYEVATRLNNISIKLRQMKASSSYIQDVYYYIPALHKVVSVSNGVSDIQDEKWQSLIDNQGNLQGAITENNGELYLLKSTPTIFNSSKMPNFILAIQLSQRQLLQQLRSVRDTRTGGAFITFGNEDKVVIADDVMPEDWDPIALRDPDVVQDRVVRQISEQNHFYSIHDDIFQINFVSYISNSVLFEPIRHYTLWMWGLTILSCMIMIAFSYWIYRIIHRPLTKLIGGFRNLERGDTRKHITNRRGDEFGYLYSQYNKTIDRLHELIEDNFVQRIRTQETQLKHLQSQIAPHFLYNSFFSIKQMAEMEDTEGIKRFSDFLGRYFRFMTRDFATEVTLEQEYEHSIVYLQIQQMRFSNRIECDAEALPPNVRNLMVPRIILQPLLENVFEHGLKSTASGGILQVHHDTRDDAFVIAVEDNGKDLTEENLLALEDKLRRTNSLQQDEETTGVANVHQRLRIRFGSQYGLQVSRSTMGGLKVEIKLPLQSSDKE